MARRKSTRTSRQTNLPNESDKYLSKREELRLAEIELMRQRERVAELRRGLPQGAALQDYAFEEGPADLDAGDTPIRTVRLSELFSAPNRSLVVYQFMFGKKQTTPCPMCTLWIDGWNGVAHHLAQNVDVAVVAAADPVALRAHARARGWHRLRLLSCGANTFKYDLGSEDQEGNQDSTMSVFTKILTENLATSTQPIRRSRKISKSAASIYTVPFRISWISLHRGVVSGSRTLVTART